MTDRASGSAPSGTWDQRILALIPSGVDVSQIVENLALSPTERIRKMVRFLKLAEAMQRGAAGGLRSNPDGA
jgi:hypothetical protein